MSLLPPHNYICTLRHGSQILASDESAFELCLGGWHARNWTGKQSSAQRKSFHGPFSSIIAAERERDWPLPAAVHKRETTGGHRLARKSPIYARRNGDHVLLRCSPAKNLQRNVIYTCTLTNLRHCSLSSVFTSLRKYDGMYISILQ
jgi:hypothetical protein